MSWLTDAWNKTKSVVNNIPIVGDIANDFSTYAKGVSQAFNPVTDYALIKSKINPNDKWANNYLANMGDTVTPGQMASSTLGVVSDLLPAGKVGAIEKLSAPAAKLAAYSALRGVTQGAIQGGRTYAETGNIKSAAKNAALAGGEAALLNVVLSPKLLQQSLNSIGPQKGYAIVGDVPNISKAPSKTTSTPLTQKKIVDPAEVSKLAQKGSSTPVKVKMSNASGGGTAISDTLDKLGFHSGSTTLAGTDPNIPNLYGKNVSNIITKELNPATDVQIFNMDDPKVMVPVIKFAEQNGMNVDSPSQIQQALQAYTKALGKKAYQEVSGGQAGSFKAVDTSLLSKTGQDISNKRQDKIAQMIGNSADLGGTSSLIKQAEEALNTGSKEKVLSLYNQMSSKDKSQLTSILQLKGWL